VKRLDRYPAKRDGVEEHPDEAQEGACQDDQDGEEDEARKNAERALAEVAQRNGHHLTEADSRAAGPREEHQDVLEPAVDGRDDEHHPDGAQRLRRGPPQAFGAHDLKRVNLEVVHARSVARFDAAEQAAVHQADDEQAHRQHDGGADRAPPGIRQHRRLPVVAVGDDGFPDPVEERRRQDLAGDAVEPRVGIDDSHHAPGAGEDESGFGNLGERQRAGRNG